MSRFSLKWAHFGSVYESALALTESLLPSWSNDPQERLARGVGLAVLLVVWIIVWRRRTALFPAARTLLFTMVLCSAAAHPWYLLWALMLIPRTGGLAPWVASLTISWGYLALGDPAGWTMPAGAAWAAWTPVYLAVVVDVLRSRRRAATMGADGEVPPGPAIGACVADLRECP